MNKFNLKLKWRLTFFSIIMMVIASAILLFTINYDIRRTMPGITNVIVGAGENFGIVQDNINNSENIIQVPAQESHDSILVADGVVVGDVINGAVSKIYITSVIAFMVVITLGGVCTYFIVTKALSPIEQLNENIKNINEHNLTCNLDVQGPNDEIKELTISFNKMITKLDNAFTSQKRFNSSIAHELKTPLAIIKTNIDVLKDNDRKNINDYEDTLMLVEKSVSKMNTMVGTLLDIVKQENEPLNEEINIDDLLEDIVDELSIIANENNVSVDFKSQPINVKILGNGVLLYSTFYNIIENAIKYNKVDGNVNIECVQQNDNIKVTVSDTGKGIEEKDFENIFKPFYRCNEINVSSNNGVGLGLSLVKSAINLHRGEIKIQSEVNKGTNFTITLPIMI